MKECKFCGSGSVVKSGKVRGQQRYRCNNCGKNQISRDARVKYSNKIRQMAIAMYLNNVGIRAIGRVLKISFQLVHSWIKKAGSMVENEIERMPRESKEIEVLEMDELYTYIQKKSGKYEYGLLLIGTEMKLLRIM